MAISFNLSSTSFSKQINNASKLFEKAASRISSGSRINSASDDAAGLAIVNQLSANIAIRGVASNNASYGQSATDIASGALSEISSISTRLNELAAQASNGTYSDSQRSALQAEYTQLREEAARISSSTEFNGVNVLNSSGTTYQVGTDGSSESSIQASPSDASGIVASLPADISTTPPGRRAAIAMTVQFSRFFIDERQVQRRLQLPQKMLLRHQVFHGHPVLL